MIGRKLEGMTKCFQYVCERNIREKHYLKDTGGREEGKEWKGRKNLERG